MTHEFVIASVNKLVDTVKVTLGAKGRTVLYNTQENKPHITKDGASVAKHIASECNYENMLMTVLRESSIKTMLSAGDGTTSTLILAQAFIHAGIELMKAGVSYYEIAAGLDSARNKITDYIRSVAINVDAEPERLLYVANIAANDEKVGKLVYDIISDIGVYGDITVKESFLSSTRVDKTKGMKLHKGWFEGFMVNNTKEMTFTAHNCYCLLFNDTIRSMTDVLPYIQYAIGKSAGLVIFCDDISDITLKQIKHSMESQPLPICFVENDGSRDRKDMLLNDLAALTRAYIVSHGVEFDPENLGMADEIKVEEMFTTVMSTNIDNETVDAIVSDIKSRLAVNDAADDMFLSTVEKKFYRKRLANLTGGVAVIHVGGATEMEMRELKDRLDDAVLAVTCAIRDGVCVGGGYTYLHAEQDLSKKASNKVESVVFSCLSAVFKQLLINADLFNKHDVIKKKLLKGYGYDLRNNSFVPKHDYKVYDAAGVLLDSVTNAIAASKSVLSVRKIVFDGIIRSN